MALHLPIKGLAVILSITDFKFAGQAILTRASLSDTFTVQSPTRPTDADDARLRTGRLNLFPLPMTLHRCVLAAVCALLLAGCDPSVDAFQENELHYSIFGYLNASADTQFVRVEPLRDGMLTSTPERLQADVTLTHLGTGRTTSLHDSLFRYLDGASAHNFYTTVDIEPTASYRLQVHGPGGAASQAQTAVPDTFPEPVVTTPATNFPELECNDPYEGSQQAVVEIRGIDRLVAVRALYYMQGVRSYSHLPDTVHTGNGVIEARIAYLEDLCRIPQSSIPRKIEVVVAAGTPDWPEFLALDLETETLPNVASNVEDGTGLLGGIVSDTVVVHPYFDAE